MLLEARHEDGSQMTREEIRDELMTLLVAGHETTASELAWASPAFLTSRACWRGWWRRSMRARARTT